jgi:ubiquinol oxidase
MRIGGLDATNTTCSVTRSVTSFIIIQMLSRTSHRLVPLVPGAVQALALRGPSPVLSAPSSSSLGHFINQKKVLVNFQSAPQRTFTSSPRTLVPAPIADRAAGTLSPKPVSEATLANATKHVLPTIAPVPPKPMLKEYERATPVTGSEIESWDIGVGLHRVPLGLGDRVAKSLVIFLRFLADTFFRDRYIARGVMLETVAAVPGMVAGSLRHLTSLRRIEHDKGWIAHLIHEAENERMHLMTWQKMIKPSMPERALVMMAQGVFWNSYFLLYLMAPKAAHRFVGYLEEEAVISYTHMLDAIDSGKLKNEPAPDLAKHYWHLVENATLRDVVLAIRADEANHRDVNHMFADKLQAHSEDLRVPLKQDFVAHVSGEFADRERQIPRIDLIPKESK